MKEKPQWLKDLPCVYCGQNETEINRIKELNQEMATALKGISYCEIPGDHQKIIIELLAKAEEEGE